MSLFAFPVLFVHDVERSLAGRRIHVPSIASIRQAFGAGRDGGRSWYFTAAIYAAVYVIASELAGFLIAVVFGVTDLQSIAVPLLLINAAIAVMLGWIARRRLAVNRVRTLALLSYLGALLVNTFDFVTLGSAGYAQFHLLPFIVNIPLGGTILLAFVGLGFALAGFHRKRVKMPVSPDGSMIWDGAQWRQLSSDGRYFWDGRTWVPPK